MKSRMHSCSLLSLAALFLTTSVGHTQITGGRPGTEDLLLATDSRSISSADDRNAGDRESAGAGFISPVRPAQEPKPFLPFSRIGVAWRSGLGGAGFDVATPLARKFNVRSGFDFFDYSFSFQEEGADVNVALRMRTGHASLDWFPFGGRFKISPLMVFANNNRVRATALIPGGSTLSMNGQDYISSPSDPLHGSGSVTFRKASPGLAVGFGNIIPRHNGHISFPVEAGFYYVGQPALKVDFSGSACDPNYPASVGCQSVTQDPGFQKDLAAFIVRNNHNLSYASFFPIFSVGFGYSF